jgi:hypothetical protein
MSSIKLMHVETVVTTLLESWMFLAALTYISDIPSVLLISIHASLVTANFVAVDLMKTHVNGELLMQIISALAAESTTKTSADPTLIAYIAFPTLVSEILFYKAYTHFFQTDFSIKASLVLYLVAFIAFSGYSPIKNIALSVVELASYQRISFASNQNSVREDLSSTTNATNVVFILNESMGNLFFQSEQGVNASSFYQEAKEGSDFYTFPNSRAASANTVTATPAALWGYLITADPKSDDARDYYTTPSFIDLAKSRNYATALYCSYDTHFASAWDNLNYLFELFDHVVSKTTLKAETMNDLGMDDRIITAKVLEYLSTIETSGNPFLLVIIYNNLHLPYLVEPTAIFTGTPDEIAHSRASFSYELTDKMTEQVWKKLVERDLLRNTIVAFMADHGDSISRGSTRIGAPISAHISNPVWFHMPSQLLSSGQRDAIRGNQRQLVSNLDVMPTIVNALGWASDSELFRDVSSSTLIHGKSLLLPLSDSRLTYGWQGAPFVQNCDWSFGFISNATHNLILRAKSNTINVERVHPKRSAEVLESFDWDALSVSEKEGWEAKIREKQGMLTEMNKCGFKLVN